MAVRQGPVKGLVRRKGEKNPLNFNLWIPDQEKRYGKAAEKIGEFATGPEPPVGLNVRNYDKNKAKNN